MEDLPSLSGALAERAWFTQPNFLSPEDVGALNAQIDVLQGEGGFHRAGVGQGSERQQEDTVRRDWIRWLDSETLSAAEAILWNHWEGVRRSLSQELFLGLVDFETHFAVYPPGGFYRRHLDSFTKDDARVLSCVLYLNENWVPSHGGELRLFDREKKPHQIEPRAGTLVGFLSHEIEHEVLESTAYRRSVAVWFRQRKRQ